jgi:DNA-binding transcriptional LysR family regulator
MNLEAVRTFVAVAEAGRFGTAAERLSLTQQAASKRVAALERELGVRLFARAAHGVELTIDGQALLPHAREMLAAEERAVDSVRPGRRALRVDVLNSRIGPALVLREFHAAHPEVELDVVLLYDGATAMAALAAGTIDATFRAVVPPGRRLPGEIAASPGLDEPIELLVGPRHQLADAASVRLSDLGRHRIRMPGLAPGVEWTTFYEELAAEFGLTIDTTGPNFGTEPLLDAIADSAEIATFVGEMTRFVWPAGHDLRRIPIVDPPLAYPHSLLCRRDNTHPALATLREFLTARFSRQTRPGTPKTGDEIRRSI